MTDITALRELLKKATPGPWHRLGVSGPRGFVAVSESAESAVSLSERQADTDIIVAAVNALPGLLDELERLRSAGEAMLDTLFFVASCTDEMKRNELAYQTRSGWNKAKAG